MNTGPDYKSLVDGYFEEAAGFWDEIYEQKDLYSLIHQERRQLVLDLVDGLHLEAGSRVFEAGCGAGRTTVALAQRGFAVEASDVAQSMTDVARENARKAGVADRVNVKVQDIYRLDYEGESFTLALAIGVMPWLDSLERPMAELARVVAPGGYVLITMDNSWGISRVMDPAHNPLIVPVKRALARGMAKAGLRKDLARARSRGNSSVDACMKLAGLEKLRGVTIGFGPFTLGNRKLLPEAAGLKLHHRLQDFANRDIPFWRSAGAQYVVLGRKAGRNG